MDSLGVAIGIKVQVALSVIPRLATALALAFVLLAVPPAAYPQQQVGKVYRVGFVSTQSTLPYVEAFRQGLRDLGYVEGQTIVIEYRWAEGDHERLPSLAKELVGLNVDVIVTAGGTPSALAVKAAPKTIPVVFLASGAVPADSCQALPGPAGTSRASRSLGAS